MISRRQILVTAIGMSLRAEASQSRLKVLVTGGHPGDPECGCAGTIARYTALGRDVAVLYLNRGQGYCKAEKDETACGVIRTAEARKACEILKARPIFAGQMDGQAVVDNQHYQEFRRLLDAEAPDILFTQWPIDEHRDHRALSNLVLDAWLAGGRKSAFYYYEVADDTMMFAPTEYVDIAPPEILSLRHAACYAHASQQPDKWFPHQEELTRFRGTQSGHSQSEAFLKHWQSRSAILP